MAGRHAHLHGLATAIHEISGLGCWNDLHWSVVAGGLVRRFQMSLRVKVVLSLTFLMASAMLLIGMVMLKLSQRDLVRAKVEQGLVLKTAVERLLMSSGDGEIDLAKGSSLLAGLQTGSLEDMTPWKITVADHNGLVAYSGDNNETSGKQQLAKLKRVMQLGVESVSFSPAPQTFWPQLPENVVIDAPLFKDRKVIGALQLEATLADVRQNLADSQKLLLFYIVLDILILVAFGAYIFSKLVVKPVQKLVQTAESFQEGDVIPDVSAGEPNELGKLSQALNNMLQRLAENKQDLRQHISSLEQANLELQRAQQEVIFSEKLASVGRLAAGIAHEIGNPIGIVLGYLELLQRKDTDEGERLELVGRMGNEIQRVNQTIRQLLDFSRPSSNEREAISVHPLIQEILEVLEHQLRQKNIKIVLELKARTDMVFANADQLKQVFLNLMVNAADAMEGTSDRAQGGELYVRTRALAEESLIQERSDGQPLRRRTDPATADYSHLRRTGVTTGERWLQIQFADTGVGIPKENQKRVFDPFYTTKEVGKGTGLGLSVSIQIIETLGGRMDLSSNAGEETRVTIQLPLYGEQAGNSKQQTEGSARPS